MYETKVKCTYTDLSTGGEATGLSADWRAALGEQIL